MNFKVTTYEMDGSGKLVPIEVAANSIKNNLKPGAVLHWGGNMAWPAQDYAVITRAETSYGVHYDLIALEGYATQRIEANNIKAESDKSVWHGQHFFLTNDTLAGDAVLDLIDRNKAKKLADEATKNQSANAFAAKVAALRALDNGLTKSSDTMRGHVLAAKNIKKELAQLWPAVKFSVRSKSYSGGNNISVHWTDGPTSKQVDAILNKYEGGSFDGSQDLYASCRTPWTEVFGDSKYIHGSRTNTKAFIIMAIAASQYAGDDRIKVLGSDDSAYIECDDNGLEHWVREAVYGFDATKGA